MERWSNLQRVKITVNEVVKLDLSINSPSYFTQQYGVNDSVYRYCQKCYEYFKNKEYSEVLKTIGICPQCAPKGLYQEGSTKKWSDLSEIEVVPTLILEWILTNIITPQMKEKLSLLKILY